MWFYLALLSAFFNALSNIARRTHGSLAQPAELAWWSLLLSIPLGVGLVLVSGEPLWTSTDYILPALAAGSINAYGGILMFRAYKYGDASAVSPVGNFLPVVLVVTSFFILGTRPSPLGLAGIFLVVAGVYYSSVSGKHALLHPLRQILKNRGSRAMLTWAVLMAVSTTFVKIALDSASGTYLMLFLQLFEFGLISIYLLIRPIKNRTRHGERVLKRWGWHVAAIAVFSTMSVFFQFQAMDKVDPSYVLSVKRLDVLVTVLLAGLFLKERHILRRFKGSLLAVVGAVLLLIAA
jgi:drug/metabolite transporter (DMT)-like permease